MNSKEAYDKIFDKLTYDQQQELGEEVLRIVYQDLNRLEKLEKENQELRNIIKILKDKIELPLENDFDVVNKDDIHLYRLRTKCLINEKEYELLKEVLSNES